MSVLVILAACSGKGEQGPAGPQGALGSLPAVATGGGLLGDGSAGSSLAPSFAGSGSDTDAARADHGHGAADLGAASFPPASRSSGRR